MGTILTYLELKGVSLSRYKLYQRQLLIDTYIFYFCTSEDLTALRNAETKVEAKNIVNRLQNTYASQLETIWSTLHQPNEWNYEAALEWSWDRWNEPKDLYK